MEARIGRLAIAICIGIPLSLIMNLIGAGMTYFGTLLVFGCFLPPDLLQFAALGLAGLEFIGAFLYSLLTGIQYVLEDTGAKQ